MPHSPRLLIVDHNPDIGSLLVRTLLRKFPGTSVEWCSDQLTAERALLIPLVNAIVIHRTHEVDAVTLIRLFRKLAPTIPIVAVSAVDRSEKALAAGATKFVKYDHWLRVGTVVADVLNP